MSTWLLGAARKVAIGILIISVLSDCACFFDKQSISEKIKKANHVEITFFNLKTGKGDEHVRTITTISELQSISQYLDSSMLSRANFSADLCKVKMNLGDSFLDITFYNGGEFYGQVGAGSNGNNYFLKYHDADTTIYSCISKEQYQEFIKLLKLPEDVKTALRHFEK